VQSVHCGAYSPLVKWRTSLQLVHYRPANDNRKALRKRQVWVELLFGEGKQWHQMTRFRLRGLAKVNIEGAMKAAGQNIKRLLNAKQQRKPRNPVGGVMLLSLFSFQAYSHPQPLCSLLSLKTTFSTGSILILKRNLYWIMTFK
jgi:hypothetical protein